MIRLMFHTRAGKYADFDRIKKKMFWKEVSDEYSFTNLVKDRSGILFQVLFRNFIFLRIEESVFIGNKNTQVEITPTTEAELKRHWLCLGLLRTLKITDNGKILFRVISFEPIIFPPLGWDFTMSEREDFDACLFISNVLNDPERRKIIFRSIEWRRENNML